MDAKKAIEILESLVVAVMGSGGFKDFAALDSCRKAIEVLKTEMAKK